MNLVTGATGFIGQVLLKKLSASEQMVRLLARNMVDDYETVCCDFVNDVIPAETVESIDNIFHLAGYAHDLGDASKVENLYRAVNVNATVRLTELAATAGVKRFVFVSSVKAGGPAVAGRCMTEADQGTPDGIYGVTKREAELKVLEIGRQSGMHVSIVRPSLVYGPGVKGNLRMMMAGIHKGWFPPLPETGNRRSMVHVDDLVRAILLASQDKRANGEIYIASDGRDYSTRFIYESICQAVGRSVPNWSMPKSVFTAAAYLGDRINRFPFDSYRYQKLLGDGCYSSKKLFTQLRFVPIHTLHSALPQMVDTFLKERYNNKSC